MDSADAILVVEADQSPFIYVTPQTGARYGSRVAAAPGFRNDGETRLVVGGELWDGSVTDGGFAATYAPRVDPGQFDSMDAEWLMVATAAGDRLGSSLSGNGDVNDDGINDLAIGAYNVDVGGQFNVGAVYVRFGQDSLPPMDEAESAADLIIRGEEGTDHFGFSVLIDGDVNGDGVHDIVVGSPLGQGNGVSTGEVFIYFGGADLTSGTTLTTADADVHIRGDEQDSGFGYFLAAGNVNGDAADELMIGAPSASPLSRFHAGAAYVFVGRNYASGASYLVDERDIEVQGAFPGDACGSACVIMDLDDDDLGEVLVGSPLAAVGSDVAAGRVYVFSGTPITVGQNLAVDTRDDAARILSGDEPGDLFGWSIASAMGINIDSEPDLLVGAPGADPQGVEGGGVAFLRLSVPGVLPAAGRAADVMDRAYVGVNAGDEVGASVSGILDFNDDDGGDFVIGAPGFDAGGFESGGAAYVFTGATLVSVAEGSSLPLYLVGAPTPNPTTAGTRLRLLGPADDALRVSIVDATGRVVRAFGPREVRGREIVWDGRDGGGRSVSSGVYFLSVAGALGSESTRIVVTR